MNQKLTEGNIGSTLVKLTIPMIWGVFAVIVFNLVDTYFVGQLGKQPLAAMSFTFPVVMTLGSLSMGLGVGASSVISRAIGEGDRQRVQKFTTNSLTLALTAVAIFVILGFLTIDPLFKALGVTDELMPLVKDYMQIWYIGMIFLVVPMVGNSAIRASGNTVTPSLIMIFAGFVNIVLDPLFIMGWWGFPRMELQGAALATVISRGTTLIAALIVLHFKERMLYLGMPSFKTTMHCWKDILHVGLPAAAGSMINPISIGVVTSILAGFGTQAVAAFGIASRVESFGLVVLVALSASLAPFIGQNWGAKKYERVRRGLQLSFIFCLCWGLILAVVLALIAPTLVTLFNNNPDVVAIASDYFWIVPISYAAAGIILVSNSAFNALGKPILSVLITVARMIVLYIPLAYIGGKMYGVNGIFGAASISNLLVGIGAYICNQKNCSVEVVEKIK